MSQSRSSRRDFLRAGCGLLACGGVQALLPQLGLIPSALAGTPPGGYRALVCLYLGGGNDGWNLLIPGGATEYAEYASARNGVYNPTAGNGAGLALPRWNGAGLVAGQTPPASLSIGGGQYGLNPFCPDLAQLYGEGRLAFVANVGTLVHPTTRAAYNARPRPPQLYSHNDQTNLWHIGSGSSTAITRGWGGQVAGKVAVPSIETGGLPPTITLSGQNRFLVGVDGLGAPLFPFSLSTSSSSPATSLSNYSATSNPSNQFQLVRRQHLEQLLDAASPQAFTNAYGSIVDRSLELADFVINPAIVGIPASDPVNGGGSTGFVWPTGSSLSDQLRQVARMIRISTSQPDNPGFISPVQANRQVFFVSLGGFDTHDSQITSTGATGHHLSLQRVSQAVNAFYRAMGAIGRQNDVTLFSASEFGRTINSNGNGSDHAWGGVQFALGGAVNGGQVYGRYPRIVLNNALSGAVSVGATLGECFSRGQFLPTTAADQFSATLARWMGVSDLDLPTIFPNIDNFVSGPYASSGSTPSFASFSRTIPGLMNGVG
jgi:uncharacterized protein (DUF1501 family)